MRDEDNRAILLLQHDPSCLETLQGPQESPLARDGLRGGQPRALARETEEVGLLAQRPVQARRRDLKRIGVIDRILHVEEVTQLFARSLTISQSQTATLIDIKPKDTPT